MNDDLEAELAAVEHPVPDALQERVLDAVEGVGVVATTARDPVRWGLGLWALAATGLLSLAIRPPAVPEVSARSQTTEFDGRLAIVLDEQRIDLDGRGRIDVEERDMKSAFIGAGAGAALTFVLMEGTAVVSGHGESPRPLAEGERAIVRAPQEPTPTPSSESSTDQREDSELERLREEVAQLRVRAGLVEGQLAISGTQPIAWPRSVPDALGEAQFGDQVQAVVDAMGNADLQDMLCNEYPCISVVRADDEATADRYFDEGQDRIAAGLDAGISVRTMSHDGDWYAFFAATGPEMVDLDDTTVNHRVVLRIHDYFDTL